MNDNEFKLQIMHLISAVWYTKSISRVPPTSCIGVNYSGRKKRGKAHEKKRECVRAQIYDETTVTSAHDETTVTSAHDETTVTLAHDETTVTSAHDETTVTSAHDETTVTSAHDETTMEVNTGKFKAGKTH